MCKRITIMVNVMNIIIIITIIIILAFMAATQIFSVQPNKQFEKHYQLLDLWVALPEILINLFGLALLKYLRGR